ncbi:DUF456 domain-containing protein [Dyadobacter luteus]|jgi:uncharacterized protein YqgC (DUF456 family)|uniref:DUF456 domain-containing protein n=1 Tax=Dyadobacter luteus TaxID=2259619 RepID=A0A3D8YEC6_9BACT|nr:DUF456 domain-containing protein [Dyadobacter luteus]REA61226.1 DUF456 domain-containing protein [Dyadobacter luteus]
MDILLLIAGIACLLVGLAGAVLPLPGPPLSYGGLILLHISKYAEFSKTALISLGFVTVVIAVLDYYIPIWGTKKFGGTKYGAIGATLGLLVGFLFIPAIGIFIGTFLGALVGELIGGAVFQSALKSAFGSFIGFITGIAIKVLLCLVMIGFAVYEVWDQF